MNKLHPRAFWLFFLQGVLAFGITLLTLSGLSVWFLLEFAGATSVPVSEILTAGSSVILIILVAVILWLSGAYIWAWLFYEFYRYQLAPEGVKIEKGVIWKHYVTIPYSRVQNVDIMRGLLARLLGLSDLHIQTAGASGAVITEGRLPGLARQDAEALRSELVARLGDKKQGL